MLAAFYLAFPTASTPVAPPSEDTRKEWFNTFAAWMEKLVFLRTGFLRAALLALAFGALFLPVPFLQVETKPSAPPTRAEWPVAPSDNVKLQKILYEAQVAEVAKLREKAAPPPEGEFSLREWWIWLAAGVALLVVLLVALFGKARGSAGIPGTIRIVPFFR